MLTRIHGRILIVAGSDSGGGAGIQADIKTVTALAGYAATAVTAITVQNTQGVTAAIEVSSDIVSVQMISVLSDIGADAVKTGMLASTGIIEAVAGALASHAPHAKLVCDPVMVAKGGHKLISDTAIDALKALILPRATVLTPNLPEAEVLTGMTIRSRADMEHAAQRLHGVHGVHAVLIKGGHLPGSRVPDLLFDGSTAAWWEDERIEPRHTHGTGCTLASAIACSLAQGLMLEAAVTRARDYVRAALISAPGLGRGHGPLNHAHTVRPFPEG
ncbi:MAG TPA: bifunctional hydroxymethylpyrimidine kinase/phosphomethylpyrimidine kinase [Alphaproteobacteria bacterium]|nr:bifunctional hydroxymethylpyrimidine kinase/phosphomethylpyrimidine kinase [Alphaproteobacteria bacterium]